MKQKSVIKHDAFFFLKTPFTSEINKIQITKNLAQIPHIGIIPFDLFNYQKT